MTPCAFAHAPALPLSNTVCDLWCCAECVIREAPCFLLVGKHLPEVAALEWEDVIDSQKRSSGLVPTAALEWCAFFRVWCLVELSEAIERGKAVVLKLGQHESHEFVRSGGPLPNNDMLHILTQFVNVEEAAASVESDRCSSRYSNS